MEPSVEVLRGLLAAAPDALLAIDPEGRIVFVSDQAEHLFGWARADLVGQTVEVLVPVRFSGVHSRLRTEYMERPMTRAMGGGLELWARRRDGTEFPAEISLSAFPTNGGQVVAAAIRDVTVARRAEQRFRAVLDSAPDATVGVGASGRIELVNAQVEQLFGWTPDEVIGMPIEMLVPEVALDGHARHRDRYMEDPEPRPMGAGLELSARRKDGSTFPAEISLSAVTDDPGDRLVLASVRDVTDRIELEAVRQRAALADQREQSHRLESLGQLAGGVAHDFNNLLSVILNYATLLTRRVTDPVVAADLEEIRAAAERGASLTRQLLTFARRDVPHFEPLDLNEIVQALASMLRRTLGAHIELHLDLERGPSIAMADRHQLEQIVLNLALNARDAMPEGGVLTIAAEPSGTDVELSIVDTGIGMVPEVVARAFEPFFTTKATGEGTGLGLATVYGIVQQSGGSVAIESAPAHGTTVTVVLPRSATEPTHRATAEPPQSGQERILLVEDEAALRVGMARMLTERGYDVLTACDGVDALEVLDRERTGVDLVVTDVAMPRMRGDELVRRLAERSPDLKVICMSGYESSESMVAGRLLAKPVREEVLLRTIREVLDG